MARRQQKHIRKPVYTIASGRMPGQMWFHHTSKTKFVLLSYELNEKYESHDEMRRWKVLMLNVSGAIEVQNYCADKWANGEVFSCIFTPAGKDV